jgi:uncharacterized protein (DUF1778 family)
MTTRRNKSVKYVTRTLRSTAEQTALFERAAVISAKTQNKLLISTNAFIVDAAEKAALDLIKSGGVWSQETSSLDPVGTGSVWKRWDGAGGSKRRATRGS